MNKTFFKKFPESDFQVIPDGIHTAECTDNDTDCEEARQDIDTHRGKRHDVQEADGESTRDPVADCIVCINHVISSENGIFILYYSAEHLQNLTTNCGKIGRRTRRSDSLLVLFTEPVQIP